MELQIKSSPMIKINLYRKQSSYRKTFPCMTIVFLTFRTDYHDSLRKSLRWNTKCGCRIIDKKILIAGIAQKTLAI